MNEDEVSMATLNTRMGQLKGYLFEVIIRKWLKNNDFILVMYNSENIYLRQNKNNFLEMRGRGSWHQIDVPCDYYQLIPFVNPIRLLCEVKFHCSQIGKSQMREFIGVIKDISENYIVPIDLTRTKDAIPNNSQCLLSLEEQEQLDKTECPYHKLILRKDRFTEIGVFFSASGFNAEAENLAFAHNVQTISYKNNHIVRSINECITDIVQSYIDCDYCLSKGNHTEFINGFYQLLNNTFEISSFKERFRTYPGFEDGFIKLKREVDKVQSSFFATTSAGVLIHFTSESKFPTSLFFQSDEQQCTVYYENEGESKYFFMLFNDLDELGRFYFTPPTSLYEAAYRSPKDAFEVKMNTFKKISVFKKIHGVRRILTLTLKKDWSDAVQLNLSYL